MAGRPRGKRTGDGGVRIIADPEMASARELDELVKSMSCLGCYVEFETDRLHRFCPKCTTKKQEKATT